MLPAGKDAEIEVSWEDQRDINEFSKLNARLDSVMLKVSGLKKDKIELDDASQELEEAMLLFDEDDPESVKIEGSPAVSYKIGDTYFTIKSESAQERLEEEIKVNNIEQEKSNDEVKTLNESMDKLKTALYKKFGDSINLERE